MSLDRSVFRHASRKGRGFATPGRGMAEQRPQRVAMQGRRDGRHTLFSSLLGREKTLGLEHGNDGGGFVWGATDCARCLFKIFACEVSSQQGAPELTPGAFEARLTGRCGVDRWVRAPLGDRAAAAVGVSSNAQRGAEIHKCLVPVSCRIGDVVCGVVSEVFARKRLPGPSAQHPREVGIDSSDFGAKTDRRNSGGCVWSNPVEFTESFNCLRPSVVGYRASCLAQSQRTRVVSKTRPCSEQVIRLGPREILYGWP